MQIETENNKNQNAIIIILIALVVCLLLGILIMFFLFNAKFNKLQVAYNSQPNIPQEKSSGDISSAISNISSGNMRFDSIASSSRMHKNIIPKEIASIAGIVKKIEGRNLKVETNLYGEVKDYTVIVGKNTTITKRESKKDQIKPDKNGNIEIFDYKDAIFDDILQYDIVEIEAGENVKDKDSFIAKAISIIIPEFSQDQGNLFIKEISNSPR